MTSKELKKAGLKVTTPRLKILNLLAASTERHLSAEDIYKILARHGDDIALATVYRVLTQFEAAGLVIKHNFEGEHSVFELDNGEHHDHLVCLSCGKVEEFVDELIEERQEQIAKKMNFKMQSHSLYIFGLCLDCHS